jgi:hypothetical protein
VRSNVRASLAIADTDAGLPALERALDPVEMLPMLAGAADIADADGCSVEILKYWAGHRCTVLYTVERGAAPPLRMLGKLYGRPQLAARVHQWTCSLEWEVFGAKAVLTLPAPIGLLPELGIVLQEHVPGPELQELVSADCDPEPLELAGAWLARLHAAPRLDGLGVKTLEHELEKLGTWSAEVLPHLGAEGAREVRRAHRALRELAVELPPAPPTMIHRDFYPGNMLWDGRRLCVLDLDWLSAGDPALDVGYFLAQIENLAYRRTGEPSSYADLAERFLDSYLDATQADPGPRLRFYRAYTFLNLAAAAARRQGERWQERLPALAELACAALDEKEVVRGNGPGTRAL